jgi:transcriptional regulator with XRE-family HTH domain
VFLIPAGRWTVNVLLQPKDAVTISREQCRAARGLLNWSQPDLAKVLGVARSTIANFERGASNPHAKNLAAIRAALETAGVVFIPGTPTSGPGVHLRDPEKK